MNYYKKQSRVKIEVVFHSQGISAVLQLFEIENSEMTGMNNRGPNQHEKCNKATSITWAIIVNLHPHP